MGRIGSPFMDQGWLRAFLKDCAKTVGELHNLSRNQLHTMMGLTGHCHLKGHQFKLVLVNNPKSDRCKQASETSAHVLRDCETLATLSQASGSTFYETRWLKGHICQEDTAKHMNTRAAQRISYYRSVRVTAVPVLFVFFSILPKC